MAHCQRDTWMALPALAAVALRLRRILRQRTELARGSAFWPSLLEGVLWGLAVWIKPHVVLVAAAVWLLTARRLATSYVEPGRAAVADLLGNLAGGLVVGAAGVAWLVWSGAWECFWEVMTYWNPKYTALVSLEYPLRVEQELHWFSVWSLGLIPTLPLAVLSLIDAPWWKRTATAPGPVGRRLPPCLWDREAGPDARFARGVLAGLYLVWAVQAFFLQRGFVYVHLPETLLMLGLWAAHRWAFATLPILWITVTSTVWLVADQNPAFRNWLLCWAKDVHASASAGEQEHYLVRHPLADRDWMANWGDCWHNDRWPSRWDATREQFRRWDQMRRIKDFVAAIDWEELREVADYLLDPNKVHPPVKDYEVIAWDDSPHAVYLILGIKPGVRYQHISTVRSLGWEDEDNGPKKEGAKKLLKTLAEVGPQRVIGPFWLHPLEPARATVEAGVALCRRGTGPWPRYAIGDLEWAIVEAKAHGLPAHRDEYLAPSKRGAFNPNLPAVMVRRKFTETHFPFNQPALYRAKDGRGRYLIHELTGPLVDSIEPPGTPPREQNKLLPWLAP
jgi:hypothetical protein